MAKASSTALPALPGVSAGGASWQHTIVPISLVFILGILLFPMPTTLLDICLALNITISLVVLFASLYIERPLQFSAYPAILLITTLFRLAMNVASTRLVLLHGDQGVDAAGNVIQAFGTFVIGGNYIVGAVIFILISIVNLRVLTKGSGRIAEVAARFTLDAMPGKQMAIDSDLNTGLINETEAKARRKEIAAEAEFYGAMDGAAKFVAGDASAGVLITGINIIGGLAIGIIMKGMDWREALQVYTLLTIGDGLVSQVPAIIISTSAGIIVARAASGEDLGSEVCHQLAQSARPLMLSSAVCAGMALIPGLPFLPFVVLSIGTGVLAFIRRNATGTTKEADKKGKEGESGAKENAAPAPGSTEEVMGLLNLDALELEVGYELVSIVEDGDLVNRIRSLRRQFAIDYGFIVPPIHIRDNVRIKPGEYRFLLKGQPVGSAELKARHLLAMDPGTVSAPINGLPTKEPAFGLDALWVADADKERAQLSGYTVVDLSTVMTTHLTEMVRSHMHELLGRQETQQLIDSVKKENPKVVEDLIPSQLSLGQVQAVLARLLREQISIRDLKTILETLGDWAGTIKHPEKLAEIVRKRLARTITSKFVGQDGVLTLVSLNPQLERFLADAVQQTDEGSFLGLEPSIAQQLINRLNKSAEKFAEGGHQPLLLVSHHVRPAIAHFIERFAPGFVVLSHQEIAPNTKVQSLGVVTFE